LGHEEFQYRAFDFGESPHQGGWQRGEQGARIAQGGASKGRNAIHAAHLLGRIGFAQSEYYFDGEQSKSEWMWKQRWRARLRRFHISPALFPSGMLGACSAARGRRSPADLAALCDAARAFTQSAVSVH
jgi:hypothetical protein